MTVLRGSQSDAVASARIASERSDLWLPGALAWLPTVGWLPFLAAVVPLPGEGDVTVFGTGLVTSSGWPLNAILITAGLIAVVMAALALLALGEVVLWSSLRRATGSVAPDAHGTAALRVLAVELVSAAPAALAVLMLAAALASAAPDEFTSPDIGGSLGLRLLGRIGPFVIVAIVALLTGQALAAAAGRRVLVRGQTTLRALAGGARDVMRAPRAVAVVALGSMAFSVGYLVTAWLVLRVLWAPVATQLGGAGIDASVVLLLLGFVAIWLCLVAGGGMLHAWASVWWTLTLAEAGDRGTVQWQPREESRAA